MLASLGVLLCLGQLALAQTTITTCKADNCLRAVRGTADPTHPAVASSDCSSYLLEIVTPATVTIYVSVTQTSVVSTTSTTTIVSTTLTTDESTDTATSVSTTVAEAYSIIGLAKRGLEARQVTISPSLIPSYASACSGSVRYASACSCIGVTAITSSASAPSTTIYVTVSQVTTTVVPATDNTVVTSILSSTTTISTTATTTSTTTSIINCAPGATDQAIVNGGFESGALYPWTFSNSGDNSGYDPPTSITIQQSNAHSGLYSAYVHDDSGGSQYDEFTLTQVVTVCPGRPYTFSFWAKANQPNYCFLESHINGVSSGPWAYALGTSYAQFSQYFPGTTGGETTVTISLKDTDCFFNFYLDDFTFTTT